MVLLPSFLLFFHWKFLLFSQWKYLSAIKYIWTLFPFIFVPAAPGTLGRPRKSALLWTKAQGLHVCSFLTLSMRPSQRGPELSFFLSFFPLSLYRLLSWHFWVMEAEPSNRTLLSTSASPPCVILITFSYTKVTWPFWRKLHKQAYISRSLSNTIYPISLSLISASYFQIL